MIETSNSILCNATGLRKCRSGSFTRTFASGLSKKADEHCDHFGNMRAVVSDKKVSDIVSGLPEDFRAEVLTMSVRPTAFEVGAQKVQVTVFQEKDKATVHQSNK